MELDGLIGLVDFLAVDGEADSADSLWDPESVDLGKTLATLDLRIVVF